MGLARRYFTLRHKSVNSGIQPLLMKKVLICTGLLSCSVLHAQQNGFFNADKLIREKIAKQKKVRTVPLYHFSPAITATNDLPHLQFTLPNNNQVMILSQDHMPCIIPAPATAGLIPNAGNRSMLAPIQPAEIPNPGRRKADRF